MSTPSGILGKKDTKNGSPVLHGTVYEANFSVRGRIGEVTLVAGLADSGGIANELWTYYRKSDKPSLMAWLNHIPFYYGSYEKSEEETFILCWFSKKWFFRVEGPSEDIVRDFYKKLELFIQKNEILNGSIREI
jgi:hypothetical protein